ncbi:MAG: GAF domain-containing protein, partial [Rubricoccaceae bacterium]|nr:GAF domain-containing protein [Rubricoccaceae bacterium]
MALTQEDQHRLDALKRFFVLDHAPSEDELSRLVKFTGQLFGVAYAALALRQDDGSEEIVASYGFELSELPEGAVLMERPTGPSIPVAVEDASQDERFSNNPIIHGDTAAKMFAGVPLKSGQGFTLGTLALMDPSPQEMNGEGVAMLAEIGALVEPVLQFTQVRDEHERAQDKLRSCNDLARASVAAADVLDGNEDGVSDALHLLADATHSQRIALFEFVPGAEGILSARCHTSLAQNELNRIAEPGDTLDLAGEGLSHWLEAFTTRTPVVESASNPFFTGKDIRHLVAVALGDGQNRPGFVVFER